MCHVEGDASKSSKRRKLRFANSVAPGTSWPEFRRALHASHLVSRVADKPRGCSPSDDRQTACAYGNGGVLVWVVMCVKFIGK